MPLKERLVDCHILYRDGMLLVKLDDLVDEQERISVGKERAYAVDVDDRLFAGIIQRSLHFLMPQFLA